MKNSIIALILALSACATPEVKEQVTQNSYQLKEGDILFQDLDCGPFCESICSVTEGYQGNDFSHCGIIVKTTYGWGMLEAVSKGVVVSPLDTVLNRATLDSTYFFGRINDTAIAIDAALARAHKLIGANYDVVFDITNDDYYCSEVLYKAFLKEGQPIFSTPPMTYKIAGTDSLDPIWVDYFENLAAPIPEGEPGLNPGGVSLSKYVAIFEVAKGDVLPLK